MINDDHSLGASLSLPIRRCSGGGILTEGEELGAIGEVQPGQGYAIYPASKHLHEDMTYCCLSGIIWALSCCYNSCGCLASRAPGIRLIKTPGCRFTWRVLAGIQDA
jgi:hypothetical protein